MICSSIDSATEQFPLPNKPMFTGNPSADWNICSKFHLPLVMVVPLAPSVGPIPPPIRVVIPLLKQAYACWGAMKCTCPSIPPAVRIRCSPLMASVDAPVTSSGLTPSMVLGFPALPMPAIFPSLMPTSAFITPSLASMMVTLVMTKSSEPCSEVMVFASPMPSRMVFPPPYTASSPYTRRSFSISIYRFVSPNLILSPTVGPNRLLFSCLDMVAIIFLFLS